MRTGRHYDVAGGVHATRWPFAIHEVRVAPLIAPDFQASFEKILTTTRYHFDIQRDRRTFKKRTSARR